MKLIGQTIVLVPYFDSDGMKQWVRMSFQGEMDDRFMYKQVRKYIEKEFGKKVDTKWIKECCPIINDYKDKNGTEQFQGLSNVSAFDTMVEEWIQRLEAYEDEDNSDSVLQIGNSESSKQSLPNLPSIH